MLDVLNATAGNQKLRLIFEDTGLVLDGAGEEEKVSYADIECALETGDLIGLIFDNKVILLQKQELLLGNAEDLTLQLKDKVCFERI